MRVLHWYPNYLGGGGVGNAVLGLASAQARLGATVAIAAAARERDPLYEATMRPEPPLELLEWLPRRQLRRGSMTLRLVPREAAERLRAFAPDIVHAHGEFNPDNAWPLRLLEAPLVLSPQGAFHPVVLEKSRRLGKRLYILAARRALYRRLAFMHALSPMEAEDVARNVPGVAVYTAPQGGNVRVSTTSLPPAPPRAAAELLFVGRLDVYTKGLDILLDAFARLNCTPPARMTLVGPDWKDGRAALERQAAALGIAGRVELTGPLRGAEVSARLAGADLYVQLSRHEGFPLSVSEALSAGKPAVLTRTIGTVSYPQVRAWPHVRVVAPDAEYAAAALADALARLEEVKAAAERSRDEVREFFSWERIAAIHLERYAEAGR